MARSWVQMRFRNTWVTTYTGTNKMSNISLVHRNVVYFVFTWTWLIQILGTKVRLHTEAELGDFTTFLTIVLGWITEVEIAHDIVLRRSRRSSILNKTWSLTCTELDRFTCLSYMICFVVSWAWVVLFLGFVSSLSHRHTFLRSTLRVLRVIMSGSRVTIVLLLLLSLGSSKNRFARSELTSSISEWKRSSIIVISRSWS
mmetsp:Transcript_21707/g.15548  ORF Transcript_21707/g.15548 Transcript_21707/m.15548 type:complete len:200 (+) Transcript_21707:345-944(+)